MTNRPNPLYDTRKHFPDGLQWRGYVYESVPKVASASRLMIVEDHDDFLIVSDYSCSGGWSSRCEPVEPFFRSNRIGLGRPTKRQREVYKVALKELQA